jgi:hypothetical protein
MYQAFLRCDAFDEIVAKENYSGEHCDDKNRN